MNNKTKAVAVAAGVLVLGGVGVSAVMASDGSGSATDTERDRAEQVGLEHIGEGSVTGFEAGDEEGAYEVEVTRDDGSEVDVHLDESFTVISSEDESTEGADDDGPGEDDDAADNG
ncbi:MAG: hypothetical protein M3419_01640 [Actinomycetota bacterium]|nr:hypothetical protein [Actinomycetota bacterium]